MGEGGPGRQAGAAANNPRERVLVPHGRRPERLRHLRLLPRERRRRRRHQVPSQRVCPKYVDVEQHRNSAKKQSIVHLFVTAPPPILVNVTVQPSTILALIIWAVNGTGGHPISHFTAQFKQAYEDDWKTISPMHISPNAVSNAPLITKLSL